MFRFTQEPSSGSQSQCLAKITGMVPFCLSIRACQCFGGILRPVVSVCSSPCRKVRVPAWAETCWISFYIFNVVFNNITIYTTECISWTIKYFTVICYMIYPNPTSPWLTFKYIQSNATFCMMRLWLTVYLCSNLCYSYWKKKFFPYIFTINFILCSPIHSS